MSSGWLDIDVEYARAVAPRRGGALSDDGLQRIGRRLGGKVRSNDHAAALRLLLDARTIRHRLHWVVSDLVSAREYGQQQATEAHRLRNRITEIVAILTDEQRTRLVEDAAGEMDDRDRSRPTLRVMEDDSA